MDSKPNPSGKPSPDPHRGAGFDPVNRFVRSWRAVDPDIADLDPAEEPAPKTQFLEDISQSALTRNDSPDIGFEWSLNPYRGCEHGCAYCYARPFHEYLGFGAGLEFETKIVVKPRLPELLRAELSRPSWKPDFVALSGVTDCYQPAERRFGITRGCLEVMAEFRNPVAIVTKNALVTRDIDLLTELARHRCVVVFLSLTTLDPSLRSTLEPRTSPPVARLAAIRKLAAARIPVGVLVAPVIPAVNSHEIPHLLEAAAEAGARFAGHVVLRLPNAVAPIFEDWLVRHLPERKDKVLGQVRSMRNGAVNDPNFGSRMRGSGFVAEQIHRMFEVACSRHGLARKAPDLSVSAFRRIEKGQGELF